MDPSGNSALKHYSPAEKAFTLRGAVRLKNSLCLRSPGKQICSVFVSLVVHGLVAERGVYTRADSVGANLATHILFQPCSVEILLDSMQGFFLSEMASTITYS